MSEIFYAAAILACPVGMGVMMWFMMRGMKASPPEQDPRLRTHADAELAQLRAEVDQLRARQGNVDTSKVGSPTTASDRTSR